MPDNAIRLVQRQIEQIRDPAEECVQDVYNLMDNAIEKMDQV